MPVITQLSEAQRAILEPACAREDRCVFPVEAELKGGAVGNVCKSLFKRGLVEEIPASGTSTVWRHDDTGVALSLRTTEAATRALRGEAVIAPPQAPTRLPSAPMAPPEGSQQTTLLRLLRHPDGATIAAMVEATGWQPHRVRGALSGVIGKKLGFRVTSAKPAGGIRIYKVS